MNPENAQGRSLILVAEDTDSNFLLISTILKKDYEIVRACNGIEAVEKYKTLSPALILMDIKMPLMDGLEAVSYTHLDVYKRQSPSKPEARLTKSAVKSL